MSEPPDLLSSVEEPPEPPPGLNPRAERLWRAVTTRYELRVDELLLLEAACRIVNTEDYLAEQMQGQPATVLGSQGQLVINPLIDQIRHQRSLLGQTISRLKLPDEIEDAGPVVETPTTVRARKAAQARWGRERARNAALGSA